MKLKNIVNYIGIVVCSLVIVACSSGGNNSSGQSGTSIVLSLSAPGQYPAGVAFTAYLTITNTSENNVNDLVYSVESNYTGKQIIINPEGAGQDCTTISAGSNCMFTAEVPVGTTAGSFSVVAQLDNHSANHFVQKLITGKLFQTESQNSFSVSLSLINIPETDTPFYILPGGQTLVNQAKESMNVYVSVMVQPSASLFNNLVLMDETGNFLNYHLLNPNLETINNGVNTYKVIIPSGKTLQSIQALSALNNIATCVTNCSNISIVHVSESSIGVLSVEPTNFVMSESHEAQVIVLRNTGTNAITNLQLPELDSNFTVSDNTCDNVLPSASSCQFVVNYTVGIYSGESQYRIGYNNGKYNTIGKMDIRYSGTPAGILTLLPHSLILNAESPVQTFKLVNTGNSALSLTALPELNLPLLLVNNSCQLNRILAVGESCNYTVGYLTSESGGSQVLNFSYNNGNSAKTISSTVNWETKLTSNRYIFLTNSVYTANLGGFTGANTICQQTASNMKLPGTFIAVLQASSLGIIPNPAQPIVNLIGQVVFESGVFTSDSQYSLWKLSSNSSVNICVQGNINCQDTRLFWSGVTPQSSVLAPYAGWSDYPNTAEQNSCNNWTLASPYYNGVFGNTGVSNAPVNTTEPYDNQSLWVWENQTCDNTLSLLCIQQ